MKSFITSLLLLATSVLPAFAMDDSLKEYEAKLKDALVSDDFGEVRALFSDPRLYESVFALKMKGNGFQLGLYGLDKNEGRALKLYQAAHQMGDEKATFYLGLLHIVPDSHFFDKKQGYQFIAEAALKGVESAQYEAAFCFLDKDCFINIRREDMSEWFTENDDFYHSRAINTLKVAISLPAVKDKLANIGRIIATYSDVLNNQPEFNPDQFYIPGFYVDGFQQLEYWMEIGVAEKNSAAALSLSAICFLEEGMCNDFKRSESLSKQAVLWSPELADAMFYRALLTNEESDIQSIYEAVGMYIVLAREGDVSYSLKLHHMFKHGIPALDIAPNPERASYWLSLVNNASPDVIYQKYEKIILSSKMEASTQELPQHFLDNGLSDNQIAEVLFEIAIEKNYPEALITRASEYIVAKNYADAVPLVKEAAFQNDAFANYLLSNMFTQGAGVEQNKRIALQLLEKAALLGYADAQMDLGVKYYQGHDMTQDYFLAYAWLNLAAESLDKGIEARDAIATLMTESQLQKARMLSAELRMKIKSQGDE